MIIKLQRWQPELRLLIGRPKGLGGPPDVRDLRLVIRAPAPHGLEKCSEIRRYGFWPGNPPENDPPPQHELPALVYPCFELSEDGEAVFRLDSQLWKRGTGRYLGHVNMRDHTITVIDLDLGPVDWRVMKAEVKSAYIGGM
jgi:hypothetical protein